MGVGGGADADFSRRHPAQHNTAEQHRSWAVVPSRTRSGWRMKATGMTAERERERGGVGRRGREGVLPGADTGTGRDSGGCEHPERWMLLDDE